MISTLIARACAIGSPPRCAKPVRWRCRPFAASSRTGPRARSSPVSEADLAVDALLRERLLTIQDAGWLSEETRGRSARACSAPTSGWSIRSTARAPISRAARLGGVRRAGECWPSGGCRALRAGDRRTVPRRRRRRRDAQRRRRSRPAPGIDLDGREVFWRQAPARAAWRRSSRASRSTARIPSLALRLARVATGALDGTFAAPNSHDWDLAAADLLVHEAGGLISTLTGQSLIYNRPDPVHGALVAAGRVRHAVLLGHIRDRLAEFA